MKKRIVTLISAFFMLFSTTAFAAEKRGYVEGGNIALDLTSATKIENGKAEGKSLSLSSGSAEYEFYLRFYSDKVKIKTPNPGQTVEFTVNGITDSIKLEEAEATYTLSTPVRRGEVDLKIKSSGSVVLNEVRFVEITEEKCYTPTVLATTDYQNATATGFIIRENCPVIKDNTAIRYLNYDDIKAYPFYHGGSLYISADALSQALDAYFEEDREKDFFVIRKDGLELVYLNGSYTFINDGKKEEVSVEKTEKDGLTCLPVRQISELFGKTVIYKDGFVIVDYRSRAKALANEYFDDIKSEFDQYMPKKIGTTYYVSKESGASDNNDGSENAPFATISKAAAVAAEGDTVIIGGGEYRETIKPQNDGTAGNPITFKAKDGEKVELYALDEITNFEEYKDGIVVAAVPWDMGLGRNQLFYKNENLVEARYPNTPVEEDGLFTFSSGLRLDPVWITQGDLQVSGENTMIVTSETLLNEPDNFWKDAVYVCQQGSAWTLSSAIVGSSTKGQLKLSKVSSKWWFNGGTSNPNYGYLTCHVGAIDLPGEWTIKDGILYMMPPEGETAETLVVSVKKRQLLIDLNDREYVHIEGINGFGGGVRMNNSKMCVINHCDLKYISHYTFFDDNRNLYIDDGDITNQDGAPERGEVGVYVGGSDNAFINSKINYSAGAGLFIVGAYGYFHNNEMHDLAYGGTSCGGIHVDTRQYDAKTALRGGHKITNNTFSRVARNAFSIQRTEGSGWGPATFLPMEIAYNDVSDSSICTLDTGMMYVWGSAVEDDYRVTETHHNYLYSTARNAVEILGAFYDDNYMVGHSTYDNIIFANQPGQFRNNVYEQSKALFSGSYATVDSWNNINAGIKRNGKKDLSANDFPGGKPFKAGVTTLDTDYDLTYRYYTEGEKDVYYVADAEISEGVEVNGGSAKFTGENQYIRFKDVDFSNDLNRIFVAFKADYYKDYDNINVIVGDSPETGTKFAVTLNAESKELSDNLFESVSVMSLMLDGKNDVWIESTGATNSTISKIYLTGEFIANSDAVHDYTKIYGGEFAKYKISNSGQSLAATKRAHVDPDHAMLMGTWGGGWAQYVNVEVKESVDNVTFMIGSGSPWDKNGISVRIGSPDGEVLARIESENTGWSLKEISTRLNRTLEPGTYDIYLTFDGDDLCSDIYWFGFSR